MSTLAIPDKSAASVVSILEKAKNWLATAVEMTGPEEIAAAKAQIRTAEVYAKELHLSKEIQLDAAEMVRRAEYALSKAIRKGQEEGTISRVGSKPNGVAAHDRIRYGRAEHVDARVPQGNASISPAELVPNGNERHEVYALADGVEPEQFEAALEEAKSEGNLSRANVVRKVKQITSPQTRDLRADMIASLAAQGYSSRQMPERVGVAEETVRRIARDFGIEIPADKIVGRTRRLDHTHMVESTVTALDNTADALAHIDLSQVDLSEADEWVTSLTNSLRRLNRFKNQIKEMTHVV